MVKYIKKVTLTILASMLFLTACAKDTSKAAVKTNFATETSTKEKSIPDGILKLGIVSGAPLQGVYNYTFAETMQDAEVLKFIQPSLFRYTSDYQIDEKNPGLASIKYAEDLLSLTVTLQDDLKWDDGMPLTTSDYAYAFEVIGHPDYRGLRFGGSIENIKGIKEYKAGKVEKIVGIEIIDDQNIKFSFETADLSMKSNFWEYPMPRHVFKDIPISEMIASPEVRTNVIGYGPFKVEKVIPGESVKLVRNELFGLEMAKLAGVEIEVVPPTSALEALRSGDVDMIDAFPSSMYEEEGMPENVEFLGQMTSMFSYIGFKLGTYNEEKNENIVNKNAKMADKELRQAMMYALNVEEVAQQISYGLNVRAKSIISPIFANEYDDKAKGFTYDPEKAKQILDEAGYIDVDGDGIRDTPDGKDLVINYAAMQNNTTAETRTKAYIQNWAAVGLNVQWLDGKLLDPNTFYEKVQTDDPSVDIYEAVWNPGFDQHPQNLWGPKSASNFTRYQSATGNQIIEELSSEKAVFDEKYRKAKYDEWQRYFQEEVPAAPTTWYIEVKPVNRRVKNFSIAQGKFDELDWANVELTASEPIRA